MPSVALHQLHKALDKLSDAYHENKLTEEEFRKLANELLEGWIRMEDTIKATHSTSHSAIENAEDRGDNVINVKFHMPKIIVEKDHEGFFEALVKTWCIAKKTPWHSNTIVIMALPLAHDAVTTRYNKDHPKTLHIQFASALRRDFNSLSKEDIQKIIDDWF